MKVLHVEILCTTTFQFTVLHLICMCEQVQPICEIYTCNYHTSWLVVWCWSCFIHYRPSKILHLGTRSYNKEYRHARTHRTLQPVRKKAEEEWHYQWLDLKHFFSFWCIAFQTLHPQSYSSLELNHFSDFIHHHRKIFITEFIFAVMLSSQVKLNTSICGKILKRHMKLE